MVADLIYHAKDLGYELTFGNCYRSPADPTGHPNSLHRKRLAVDFNLFINGKYIIDTEPYSKLHDYWDSIGGAKRIESDLNHFSYPYGGMR